MTLCNTTYILIQHMNIFITECKAFLPYYRRLYIDLYNIYYDKYYNIMYTMTLCV